MKSVLIIAVLSVASWAQNTVVVVPPSGGVIPPPDIVKSVNEIANAPAKARARQAETEQIKQQTKLLKEQTEALKKQNELAKNQQITSSEISPISVTGNAFLSKCENYESAPVECVAYVAGVIDGLQFTDSPLFCAPSGVTYGQDLRVFIKYLKEHPESLQHSTRSLIASSHMNAFPCSAQK